MTRLVIEGCAIATVDGDRTDHDVAVGVLTALGVDRGDRAALDDGPAAHRRAASRTASTIFS